MGIEDFLANMRSIEESKPLSFYSGKRAAVDIMCWLHRGARGCARDIIVNKDSSKLTRYCISRIEELLRNGIKPFVVFDGADLPIKAHTNASRRENRQRNLEAARMLENQGKIQEADSMYYGAIEITPELYVPIIQYLIHKNIDYVVAPYEADAQLGYLARNNYVDFVISEDSDCLVYGCRCVLFKLTDGVGKEIDMHRLSHCTDYDFCGWTHDMFTYLCILCGCDYLPRIQNVGFVTAHLIVSRGKVPESIFKQLQLCRKIPDNYEQGFVKAVFTFRHQTIFDIPSQTTKPLLSFPLGFQSDDLDYLGPLLPPDIAVNVATGRIHPETHQPLLKHSLEHSAESQREEYKQFTSGMQCSQEMEIENSSSMNTFGALAHPVENSISENHFSSPFISVSFKALIEKPSSRGIDQSNDVSIIDHSYTNPIQLNLVNYPVSNGLLDYSMNLGSSLFPVPSNSENQESRKRDFGESEYIGNAKRFAVVAESPPREMPKTRYVFESPCLKRTGNRYTDEFQ